MRAGLVAVSALGLLGGCSREAPKPKTPSACLADDLGALRTTMPESDCRAGQGCAEACERGDAAACWRRALALEQDWSSRAQGTKAFRRGCELGLAPACTNYAAHMWSGFSMPAEVRWAARIFERACAAGEAFACGMEGRLILDDAHNSDEVERGRDLLERTCLELQGFPCRVLAKHLESGQLGPYDPVRIPSLLTRACAGGDSDACGATTAAPTFTE